MANAEDVRDAQRATWAGLAAGWERWDPVIHDQLTPVTAVMLGHLDPAADHRHLDIATGTGEPGLTIAARVPDGHVTLTDLAPEMLRVAERRAVARGCTNVSTRVCSADDLPFDDATFDGVTVRFGYMFLPDLAAATAGFVRVLRPRGRLCSSVWIDPGANPWTSVALGAIAREVELPPTDPDGPGMFRCAAPGCVGSLFEEAGLHDVVECDVDVELVTRSPAEYWQVVSEHVSLAVAALRGVDPATRERIRDVAMTEVSAYERDGAIRVPGRASCTVGRR
jgi:SAM-dependent methyltransferase